MSWKKWCWTTNPTYLRRRVRPCVWGVPGGRVINVFSLTCCRRRRCCSTWVAVSLVRTTVVESSLQGVGFTFGVSSFWSNSQVYSDVAVKRKNNFGSLSLSFMCTRLYGNGLEVSSQSKFWQNPADPPLLELWWGKKCWWKKWDLPSLKTFQAWKRASFSSIFLCKGSYLSMFHCIMSRNKQRRQPSPDGFHTVSFMRRLCLSLKGEMGVLCVALEVHVVGVRASTEVMLPS